MEVAVLILTHGRLELLKECLKSIQNQKNQHFIIRHYLLVNGKDEETASWLKEQNIHYTLLNNGIPVGEARNLLIDQITEDYICFLDDDIVLPDDYFEKAGSFITKNPHVDIFGGPDQNTPKSTKFQRCLSSVMESFFATGPTNKRHKLGRLTDAETADEIALILCNFWAKRQIFNIRRFPKHFRRNEENYLLSILKDSGCEMRRVPKLFVYHNRKTSISKLIRVLFLAGTYRSISIIAYPSSFRPWFVVHHVFLLLLALAAICNAYFFTVIVAVYVLVICINSILISFKTKRLMDIPMAMLLFIIFNFVYPVGQAWGYVKGGIDRSRGQSFEEDIF